MVATLFEIEHEIDVVARHLRPIAHHKRLGEIRHPFHARDRGLASLLGRAEMPCVADRRQKGDADQQSQHIR